MKKLFLVLCLTISSLAYAGMDTNAVHQAGFNRLSEAQKAEIIKQVADKAGNAPSVSVTTESVERWVAIGSNLGKGLAATAKELGIAVNEFADTPIGKLATLLIVWHLMGGVIVHIFGGLLIWAVGFPMLWKIIKRLAPDDVTYSATEKNIFGNAKIEKIEKGRLDGETTAVLCIGSLGITAAGLIAILTF